MAKNSEKHSFKRILSNNCYMLGYVARYTPGLIVWSVLGSVLNGVVGVLDTVYLAKYVLDALQHQIPFEEMLPFLLFVVFLNAIMALLQGIYTGSYFPRQREVLFAKMQEELFVKAKEMELACYDNPKFYNDFVWAMSEADEKALDVLNSFSSFVSSLTTVLGATAIVISLDPIGIMIVASSLIMEWVITKKTNKLEYEMSLETKKFQRKRDYTSRILYQADYAKEVRLSEVSDILQDNFSEANASLIKMTKKYGWKMVFCYMLHYSVFYSLCIYGFYTGYLLYKVLEKNLFTYGEFYALLSGSLKFSNYWNKMVYFFAKLSKDSLYIDKFRTFREYVPQIREKENAVFVPDKAEAICFEDVSFTYDGAEAATIKHLNLTIQPGEKVALVGYNGAGKSTIIKLLLRLYDVSEGRITLGGVDIRDLKLSSYKDYFGAVFQDYKLLSATVGENVKMDVVKDTDEQVIRNALEKSGFGEKLTALSNGTKTSLLREFDKEGVMLSGGEAQKVAIARVFPRNCQMVVLDEPSSALDPVSEYHVNKSMLEAAKDKTVIFISHRLSTTKVADRIIMLEDGQVVEQGSHEELMELGGRYAEMFNIQAEKYKEKAV